MGERRGIGTLATFAMVGALIGAGLVTVAPVAAPPARAEVGSCPDGTLPGPGNPGAGNPIWTDQNIAVYAGEDFTVTNAAAEVEGLLVVGGDATFTRTTSGRVNVGWVGVGSGVAPYPGTTMLAVGGDLGVGAGTVLDVGSGAYDENGNLLGGDVGIGGQSNPDYETDGSRYELNNGTLTQGLGPEAIAPWADWGTLISDESATFAALPATGAVTVGQFLTFTGDGTSNPQVFTVAGSVLAANPAIDFAALADDVPVIINVTGAAPITWAPNWISEEGTRVDGPGSPLFGPVSQRTLWNFPDSTSVHVAGSSQVLGSIMVPGTNADPAAPTLRVTASTNGRLYTNGSILMDGVGNEHHNYPWIIEEFDCIPIDVIDATGQVSITKLLSDEDAALLPPDTTFHGIILCRESDGSARIVEWEVAPGGTAVITGLPVGATCVIDESVGPSARLYLPNPDLAYDIVPLMGWVPPAWSVNGVPTAAPVTVVVPAPEDSTQVAVEVQNAIAFGAFTIEKRVTDAGAPSAEFTGTWSCELPAGTVVVAGTWSLAAGEIGGPYEAPVGAQCTVSEDPAPADDGGTWGSPLIEPATHTVGAGTAEAPFQVIVTNAFVPHPRVGAFEVLKVVDNPDQVSFGGGFSGTYQCLPAEGTGEALSGTWNTDGPGLSDPIEAPVGSVCTITEIAPTNPTNGLWGPPVISPGAVTITEESAADPITFTVTNTLTATGGRDDGGEGTGGELPATGGTPALWAIPIALAAIAAGVSLQLPRRRRS
ncbi:MAG TPA: choice-of-anchor A family protein [Microbacterium sp.]|nr:choice-of-anchor A family protein [Microbacterium sp.]